MVSLSGEGSLDQHTRALKSKAVCAPEYQFYDPVVGVQRRGEQAGSLRLMEERGHPNRGFSLRKKIMKRRAHY